MILSIHDVPRHERHLLYSSGLDQPRRRRRPDPVKRELKAINRSLSVFNEAVDIWNFAPPIVPTVRHRGVA